MSAASNAVGSVGELLSQRSAYVGQRRLVEIVPGREPLIGVATAADWQRWHALSRRIAWLDEQLAAIREAVAA